MVFYLSLVDQPGLNRFLDSARVQFGEREPEFRRRFEPVLGGLELAARGERFEDDGTHPSGVRRFIGWQS